MNQRTLISAARLAGIWLLCILVLPPALLQGQALIILAAVVSLMSP